MLIFFNKKIGQLGQSFCRRGLPIGICHSLLFGSTAGFVLSLGEWGASAANLTNKPQTRETTDKWSWQEFRQQLWGYSPCPPIRPDCDRNTAVDIGDSLPGDFVVSKQTPFRTGRNEVLITSPSTGTEQRFEINLPDTGSFQLYKASFDKVKVSNPEKVLGAGASLSPQQVAAKLQRFEVEFEQNAPKTVVLADGTRGEFSAGGVVIRSKDGRVIETVGRSAMQGRMRPRLMAAVPVGSDVVVAQAGSSSSSCESSTNNQIYAVSQQIKASTSSLSKGASDDAKLVAWAATFGQQSLEGSTVVDKRNQTLQEVACAKPVQCNEPRNYNGGWETPMHYPQVLKALPGLSLSLSELPAMCNIVESCEPSPQHFYPRLAIMAATQKAPQLGNPSNSLLQSRWFLRQAFLIVVDGTE